MSLENKLEQATGAIKEGFGKVTGDGKTEAEGAVEKTDVYKRQGWTSFS